ncbi:DinB family protein [Fictibacillus sp. S7]|uniref:DinB family protein n=1 Tax=Fictibacillus sp. S7 TaxID=2212476 RepID=UPI0010109987|nr:DinB family protein [Fictibacillus sp. S7]RXZ01480.1 DinB family protein [Fictibacillus sp. S7]
MSEYLFTQLRFVRGNTLKLVEGLSEEQSEIIPDGFNNNIKWNLGHIYNILERNAFYFAKEDWVMPEAFPSLFNPGTKPENGQRVTVSLSEITDLLENQIDRIEATFSGRLKEKTAEDYTTSQGLYMSTVEEFLSCNLYHEGMHLDRIKVLKKLNSTKVNQGTNH